MNPILSFIAVLGIAGGVLAAPTIAQDKQDALPSDAAPNDTPPNIILIVADDLGYGDLACYGSTTNRTPNIDALAAGGVRFTDFHSSGPMCTPTRVSILTGRYQQRFGPQFDGALSGQHDRDKGLPVDALTIADVLSERSYATACFGKWHLGYQEPFLPLNQGFDEFRGLVSGDGDYHTHIDRGGRVDWWRDRKIETDPGYATDLITQYGVDFIKRNRQRPFFLYLPHLAIHFPWQGPSDLPHRREGQAYFDDKWGIIPEPGNVAPHVKAMVEALDRGVGQIVATLQDNGLSDRTLLCFTSDNGGYTNYGKDFRNISSNAPFRGQKTQIYEGGHRVPLIVSWPGVIAPAESGALTFSADFFPTFAQLAGMNVESTNGLDGVSLLPTLTAGAAMPDRTLFWRMGEKSAVRRGPWKLCREREAAIELYRLDRDPGERKNLATSNPDKVRELSDAWQTWNRDVNGSAVKLDRPR